MVKMSKQQTRARLREQRRKLSTAQQRQAGMAVARQLGTQLFFARARHAAFYLPNDGEIDPAPLMRRARAQDKTIYLPVLHPHRRGELVFMPWEPADPLRKNRYGIPEPRFNPAHSARLWMLDLVCMPLVGFDRQGNRLGMGGGFYDRTFANRASNPRSRPLLVGLAHHFQEVEPLAADDWDVPLHAVATDRKVLFFPATSPDTRV